MYVTNSICTLQCMYHMYNPLFFCYSWRVLRLLDPNVQFSGHFLGCDDGLSGIWLHVLNLHLPNIYARNESFCHWLLHECITNADHDSTRFNTVNIWSPCNFTYFIAFLLLFRPYRRQSNRLSIPLCFTRHDNVSTLLNSKLGSHYLIKVYSSSVSF